MNLRVTRFANQAPRRCAPILGGGGAPFNWILALCRKIKNVRVTPVTCTLRRRHASYSAGHEIARMIPWPALDEHDVEHLVVDEHLHASRAI